MATLIELCEADELVLIDPLEENKQPWRLLYATPEFINWLDIELPVLVGDLMYSNLSPLEQVFAVFEEYVSGAAFSRDRRFKKLSFSPEQFIWEMKTDDVRIFGWVPRKNAFVCCFGDSADQIKLMNSYGSYVARSSYVRACLDLDEPKCCQSKEYNDVISPKN